MKIKELLYLYNLESRVEIYDNNLRVIYQGSCKYLLSLKQFNKLQIRGVDCVGCTLRLFVQ